MVSKNFPYIPVTESFNPWNSFSQEDIDNLKSWGQNIIRLGVMWSGLEPQNGVYNQTYLDNIIQIINNAGSQGIYTLIDMHQGKYRTPSLCIYSTGTSSTFWERRIWLISVQSSLKSHSLLSATAQLNN